jgi:DNA-binding NarL/FixJ family response regulator
MPNLNGLEATRQILGSSDDPPRVIVLTTFDLDEYVLAALEAGASGYLLKDAPRERIIEAVRQVLDGEAFLAPSVTSRLIEHFLHGQPATRADGRIHLLTSRETDVLVLIASGSTNAEIARSLFIGESTVKSYVANIFGKLGARDRVQATIIAYDSGLVGRNKHGVRRQ